MLIAQVSDIHASPENDHLLRFGQVLMWLTYLQPDVLVLTGDLTDGHWQEGYKQIAACLDQQNYPSLILPGNSDDRGLMLSVWSKGSWAHDAPTGALHHIHDVGGLRLIGLDSTVDAQDYGCVTDHLEWLDKQLSDADSSPSLLFTHHHVFASGIPAYICSSVCPANPVWFGTVNVPPAGDPPALMIHRYVSNVLTSHHVCV